MCPRAAAAAASLGEKKNPLHGDNSVCQLSCIAANPCWSQRAVQAGAALEAQLCGNAWPRGAGADGSTKLLQHHRPCSSEGQKHRWTDVWMGCLPFFFLDRALSRGLLFFFISFLPPSPPQFMLTTGPEHQLLSALPFSQQQVQAVRPQASLQ